MLVCDKRDRAITGLFLLWSSLNIKVSGLLQKMCLKEGEVWQNIFSNKIIVTLVTQGFPSSFLSHPVA